MNSTKKIIWIAAILILVGAVFCIGAMAAGGFDWNRLGTMSYVTRTHRIDQAFSGIVVESEEYSVRLLPSQDGECKVLCTDSEDGKLFHTVSVLEGTLTIRRQDDRSWHEHVGTSFAKMEIEVYLPQKDYESLTVRTASGRVEVSRELSFADARVETASGSVHFSAEAGKELTVKTASGRIQISNASPEAMSVRSASGSITLEAIHGDSRLNSETASGRITLTNVECREVTVDTESGGIRFTDVLASEKLSARSASGSVHLERCDAEALSIRTTSGSVKGSLLSEKVFLTDTSSGSVSVPRTVSGGVCEITTASGSIKITIE